jgi:hypothetical protein
MAERDNTQEVHVRMPRVMHRKLMREAKKSGTTINAEILKRLEMSFQVEGTGGKAVLEAYMRVAEEQSRQWLQEKSRQWDELFQQELAKGFFQKALEAKWQQLSEPKAGETPQATEGEHGQRDQARRE